MSLNIQICYNCASEFGYTLSELPSFTHNGICGVCQEINEVTEDWELPEKENND